MAVLKVEWRRTELACFRNHAYQFARTVFPGQASSPFVNSQKVVVFTASYLDGKTSHQRALFVSAALALIVPRNQVACHVEGVTYLNAARSAWSAGHELP